MAHPKGLFFFADTQGIPLDLALLHLRRTLAITPADEFLLLCQFMADAHRAGWKPAKVYSDIREAQQCGGLTLPAWMLGPVNIASDVRIAANCV